MKDFLFKMPTKVQFGIGITDQLGKTIKDMGFKKVFIATDGFLSKSFIMGKVIAALEKEEVAYTIFNELNSEPTVTQIDTASDRLKASGSDVVLAVGGGSPTDAAKAMCVLQTHEGSIADYLFGGTKNVVNPTMPLLCIPTTAGTGSEMTGVAVVSDEARGVKVSVSHEYITPKLAVIDPALHLGMPNFISATTGMDALTHAIESYVSLNAEPISDALGIYAIKMIGQNLRKVIEDGQDIEARANMAIASTIAGVAFTNGGLGVVHGIAQSMGAVAHVAHGVANGLILPYAMKKNVSGNYEKFKDIAVALGEDVTGLTLEEAAGKSVDAVFQLAESISIPMKLSDVKITKEMFPQIIKDTMAYRLLAINPVKISEKDVEEILNEAF